MQTGLTRSWVALPGWTSAITILSLIVLVAWVMAFGRTILNLRVIPRLREGDGAVDGPTVSVLIPARDEERAIERTVRLMLAQTYRNLEVIVTNDRSSDRTAAILAAIAKEDLRLIVIDGVEPPPGWMGKPWALHQASLRARGELLLFVDADVHYSPGALSAAVHEMTRSGASLIALMPHFEMHGFWENAGMPMLPLAVISYLPTWFSNRTKFVRLGIGAGTGNLVSRLAYDNAGGHSALSDSVIDDVALSHIVRKAGHRTMAVNANEVVSLRMYHGGREIVDGFMKNAFHASGGSIAGTFILIPLTFVFHLMPYFLLFDPPLRGMALATVTVIAATRLVLFRSLGYRLDNALFLHPFLTLMWGWIFLRSAWFTGFRKQLHWRGRSYDPGQTRFGGER